MKIIEDLRAAHPDYYFSVKANPMLVSGWVEYSLTASNSDATATSSVEFTVEPDDDAIAIFKNVANHLVSAIV